MRSILKAAAILVTISCCGCQKAPSTDIAAAAHSKETPAAPMTGPLSIEDWKQMEGEIKYDPTTFERLKKGDRSLRTRQGWDKFVQEVLKPEIRRESGSLAQSSGE